MTGTFPNLGLGLGFRSQHFRYIVKHHPAVGWFEIISENFIHSGGRPRYMLDSLAEHYPIVMHGVSLSIGSTDPLNREYLRSLKALAKAIHPVWISDHLCWTGINFINTHDLLPVPLTEQTLRHISKRVCQVQDYLERPLVLENPSTYMSFQMSTLSEWEFLSALVEETSCRLLLDINNVYVSAYNNNFDPMSYIRGLPHHAIVQLHLAGHQNCGGMLVDTHDRPVSNEVWALFRDAWPYMTHASVMLEWDEHIPSFPIYFSELQKAKIKIYNDDILPNDSSPLPIEASEDKTASISTPASFRVPELVTQAVDYDSRP